MEEDIKILQKFIISYKKEIGNHCLNCPSDEDIQALENLIKGYKLEKLKNVLDEQSLKEALEDYIPKSKIKEKIEELEKEKDETYTKFLGCNRNNDTLSTRGKMLEGGIQVLQELMEDK